MYATRTQLFVFLLLMCSKATFAQVEIQFLAPPIMTVCNETTFRVSVTNNSNNLLTNVIFDFEFPDGIEYQYGSALNAEELEVPVANLPRLTTTNIQPGAPYFVELTLIPDCSMTEVLLDKSSFQAFVRMNYYMDNQTKSTSALSDYFVVETPMPTITKIKDLNISHQDKTMERHITIENQHSGVLTELIVEDSHDDQIQMSSQMGSITEMDAGKFATMLTGFDFKEIGDGDEFFEEGEIITYIQKISIPDCENASLVESRIRLIWGCNAACITETTRKLETASICFEKGLRVYSGISPNGDDKNDVLYIEGLANFPQNKLTIYNRNGRIIFQQSPYDNNWKGTSRDGDLPDGSYFYMLELNDGSNDLQTGYLHIQR